MEQSIDTTVSVAGSVNLCPELESKLPVYQKEINDCQPFTEGTVRRSIEVWSPDGLYVEFYRIRDYNNEGKVIGKHDIRQAHIVFKLSRQGK